MRAAAVNKIFEMARRDPRICYLASDLQPEILERMKAEMPGRSFMFGVSEQAMIDTAVGLALEGMVPWCHTIATFLTRRCFEQVALAAQQNLPLKLLGNGGGLCYSHLGPSHLAIDDIALMRSIPNMTVVSACDAEEMAQLMDASLNLSGPAYFRVGWTQSAVSAYPHTSIGKARVVWRPVEKAQVAIISTGSITSHAVTAAKCLSDDGVMCGVMHCHTLKPIDFDFVLDGMIDRDLVVSLEEHSLVGGLGSAMADGWAVRSFSAPPAHWTNDEPCPDVIHLGIPDVWPDRYGTRDDLLRHYGLQPDQIAERIKRELGNG